MGTHSQNLKQTWELCISKFPEIILQVLKQTHSNFYRWKHKLFFQLRSFKKYCLTQLPMLRRMEEK